MLVANLVVGLAPLGVAKRRDMVPAAPPLAMLVANLVVGLAPLGVAKMALMASLKAKLRAWVGKYLSTLAKFPLQKGETPSVFKTLVVQSMTPLYGLSSLPCLIISSWFWTRSFTLSMGAAKVLETPAATPASMKFSTNLSFFSFPILIIYPGPARNPLSTVPEEDQTGRYAAKRFRKAQCPIVERLTNSLMMHG